MKRSCKYCNYCKSSHGSEIQACATYGRKHYMCKHPHIGNMKQSEFGNRLAGFIGFGDTTRESTLQLKTHPKWCPIEKVQKNE